MFCTGPVIAADLIPEAVTPWLAISGIVTVGAARGATARPGVPRSLFSDFPSQNSRTHRIAAFHIGA